jgi:hypothetical protein
MREALDDAIATISAVRASAVSEDWQDSAAHFHKVCGETLVRIRTTLSGQEQSTDA